jgi:PmbA protein
MNKNKIFDICERIAKKEKVEFIYSDVYSCSAKIESFDISKINNQETSGLMVRAIVDGYSGYTTITEITEKNIKDAIENAKKIAKLKKGVKIKDFGSDKNKKNYKEDKKILDFEISEKFLEIKKNLTKDKHIKSYEGGLGASKRYFFYINPYTFKESTTGSAHFGLQINTFDKKPSNGGESQVFTKEKDIDFISVIDKAKENAKLLINPMQGKKGNYDLLFSNDATTQLLFSFIVHPTIGELMFKKQTYLSSNFGKNIFSKNLTITEIPQMDYFSGSDEIDDEGFKTREKKIIDKGKFATSIYDQEYAILSGKKQTGNGFRESIYSPVSCDFTNVIISPGKNKQEEILSKIKNGIYVENVMGLHTSNMTNGEFSLTISAGKEIVNGKYKNTITNLNFAGNCKTAFKEIEFTKEQKFYGSSMVPGMVLPKVKLI